MGLFGGPKVSVGLDVGNSWIKAVQVTMSGSGRPQVTKFACEQSFDDPRAAIKKIFRENNFKPTVIVACLDGRDTELMINEFPVKTMAEVQRQAELKMREFNLNEYVINYAPLRGPVQGADGSAVFPVLYVSAEKAKVAEFQMLLKEAGIPQDILIMDIDILAAINAVELDQVSVGTVCLIEGGATTTNVSIVRDGVLRFTKTIQDDGGALITNRMAQTLNMSRDETERLKIKNGLESGATPSASAGGFGSSLELDDLGISGSGSSAPAGNSDELRYFGALKAELETYFDKIAAILKDYEDRHGDKVKEIVLTGGLACMKNIAGFMKNHMNAGNIAIDTVTIPDSPYMTSFPEDMRQAYTVAFGLAMRGIVE